MSCNPNIIEVYAPSLVTPQGFFVNGAVKVMAYGLAGDDYITFKRIRHCSDNPNYKRENCTIFDPEPAHVETALEYQIGACAPSLTKERNTIYVQGKEYLLPVINGTTSADLVIEVEPVDNRTFSDKEKGVEPCLPCHPKWIKTGDERCGEEFIEEKEVNSCDSSVRWTPTEKPIKWVETGDIKCGEHIIVEEVNQCGVTRWTETDRPVEWVETGKERCGDEFLTVEETNPCGETRWTETERSVEWTETGEFKCGDENLIVEEVNRCGITRWRETDQLVKWTSTGQSKCGDRNIVIEERNDCGATRWTLTDESVKWTPTGQEKCGDEFILIEEVNDCGKTRWTETDRMVVWRETGVTRCKDHFVEIEQENDCGRKRWQMTTEKCGYEPTVPFPVNIGCGDCGDNFMGYIYHPDEDRDPDATVEITDCDGTLYGYAYPTAGDGHTLAIEECNEDGSKTLIGYCANLSNKAPKHFSC